MIEVEAELNILAGGNSVEVRTYLGAAIDLLSAAHAQLGDVIAGLQAADRAGERNLAQEGAVQAAVDYARFMDAGCEALARFNAIKDCGGNA